MKILKLFFLFTIFASNYALASGSSIGNGGVGVACAEKTELFDLFEGESLYGLHPAPLPVEMDFKQLARTKILELSLTFENPDYKKFLNQRLDLFLGKMNFLPSGVGLKLTEDVDNFIIPKNCQFVQLINYRENGSVYVDSDYWQKMSEMSKAALVVHEVLYAYLREYSEMPDREQGIFRNFEKDSSRTRKVVALLFSNTALPDLGIKNSEADWKIFCDNRHDSNFKINGLTEMVVMKINGKMMARFRTLSGRAVISRAEITFSEYAEGLENINLDSLVDEAFFTFYSYEKLPQSDLQYPRSVSIREANRKLEYNTTFSCALMPEATR